MSAQDAARAVLSLALSAPALSRECARFVLAVTEPDEALVETVARAMGCTRFLHAQAADLAAGRTATTTPPLFQPPLFQPSEPPICEWHRQCAAAALAAIAQTAGGAA